MSQAYLILCLLIGLNYFFRLHPNSTFIISAESIGIASYPGTLCFIALCVYCGFLQIENL